MKEEFLHYIWKYKLYKNSKLKTQFGEAIEILNPGIHNFDSGPDFFNAKIKIGSTVWVGNIEIHIKSSDWYIHNHDSDKAYDNVILQVVYQNDKEVLRTDKQIIPTLEIKFDQVLLKNYQNLIQSKLWVPCQNEIVNVNSFTIDNWLEKLTIERLENKSTYIKNLLNQTKNNWETAFYYQIARNFGFKLNSEPFEMLAKSLDLIYLAKHKNNLLQIEALLFGQAGFLEDESGDEYFNSLKKEYLYLKQKFKLVPLEKYLWKFLRSRPGNFPTVRIAQFAQLIYKSTSLFSKIIQVKNIREFDDLFEIRPSEYWDRHYIFNRESVLKTKTLGKSAIENILINTIVPFLFVYGDAKSIPELKEKAMDLLANMKPESNSIISKWNDLNIKPRSAFDTQALIQLKNNYCTAKKCLNCQIGNSIINQK